MEVVYEGTPSYENYAHKPAPVYKSAPVHKPATVYKPVQVYHGK